MYLAGVWSREYWPLSGEFTYTWGVKSAVMYELMVLVMWRLWYWLRYASSCVTGGDISNREVGCRPF